MATMGKGNVARTAKQRKRAGTAPDVSIQLPSIVFETIGTKTGTSFLPPLFGQPIMGAGFITETGFLPQSQTDCGITLMTIPQVLTVTTSI